MALIPGLNSQRRSHGGFDVALGVGGDLAGGGDVGGVGRVQGFELFLQGLARAFLF